MSNHDGAPEAAHSSCKPARIILTDSDLENITVSELATRWRLQDTYINGLEQRLAHQEGETTALREGEERHRATCVESQQREKFLVRRLAAKEQEMQEYVCQLADLKASQAPSPSALRATLVDPSVNVLLQLLRQELAATRSRLEETQNELSAWKFTPDSNTGKRLMAKCRLLYQENEELGKVTSSGRLAKLEGELALQKSFSEEVKKSQAELDEFLQDLDEDVEGMQSTIYYLQQELRKSNELVAALQAENAQLRSVRVNGTTHDGDSVMCGNDAPASDSPPAGKPPAKRAHVVAAYDADAQDCRTSSKKVRRSSVLSLDYNDDDALVISTNGDVAISDAE